MPDDAACRARVSGQPWPTLTELIAVNVELTHALLRVLMAANSKKGAKLPKPLQIPRPKPKANRPVKKRRASISDLATLFGRKG